MAANPQPVPEPSGSPAEAVPAADQPERGIGLISATGLVIGSIIGIGVFTMPAVLASAGTSSLLVLAVVAAGAMLLAVLFGQLTRRVPNSAGGLYAYARYEFGDFAGFVTGWSYWISSWAGDAAIVASWVFYVDALFAIKPAWWGNWGIALLGLWVPALVNLAGVHQMAWFQNLTVVLKFPAAAAGRRGRVVLRPVGELRPVQRLRRQPVRRDRDRGRRGAVLVHRRGGGGDHRQAGP